MKLILLGLGVVAGIYISAEHPEIAIQIFSRFIDSVDWLYVTLKSILRGV